jgi:hypothetical protein
VLALEMQGSHGKRGRIRIVDGPRKRSEASGLQTGNQIWRLI